MKSFFRHSANAFFILVGIFSILVILSTVRVGGYKMYIVKSGSMEPKIRTGSVVISHNDSAYRVGEAITFMTRDNTTVTHRIVSIDYEKQPLRYTVKGDANPAPDQATVSHRNVVGSVRLTLPYLGYAISFIRTIPGLLVFIIIPSLAIIYSELRSIKQQLTEFRRRRANRHVPSVESAK